MLVGVASLHGSPGATTLAVALASLWPEGDTLLLELDADGGTLAPRYNLDPDDQKGLMGLVAASRHRVDPSFVSTYSQPLPMGVPAIVAPTTPIEAVRVMKGFAHRIADIGEALPETTTVCDLGRLRGDALSSQMAAAMDVVVLVAQRRFDLLEPLHRRVGELVSLAPTAVVLSGEGPYGVADVDASLRTHADAAGRIWVQGDYTYDPKAAAVLCGLGGSTRRLMRSALVRSARSLADGLTAVVATSDEAAAKSVDEPARDGMEVGDQGAERREVVG